MTGRRMCVMVCILLVGACACRGVEFNSSQGFSLTYPDTWLVLSKDQPEPVRKEMRRRARQFSDFNLNRVAVVICEESPADFPANFNVVIGPRKGSIDKIEDEVRKILTNEYSKLGVVVTDVEVGRIRVGGLEAVSVYYNAVPPGANQPQRQWQVTVLDKQRTLAITCSAPQPDFAKYEPVFASSVSSLRVAAAAASLPVEGVVNPTVKALLDNTYFRYGVIGVAVGGALMWLRVRMQRKG
ncbi:MAG: hypothetical protein NT049_12425 [Planctomycetota bacterium]|nr:hypothetical protein [Planctomycetota bacterium]